MRCSRPWELGGIQLKYDIEADWQLLDTCNYRCAYCFFPPDLLGSKLRTFATPLEWASAFDATGHVWLLHITGGEPSIYPDFVGLCEALTDRHYISINSNLSHSSLANLVGGIDADRVSFINAGFHLEERDRRFGHAAFLRNAELLRSNGFPILVSLVATPGALARFDEVVALLEPIGLFPIPKLLRGPLDGKVYPGAYTEPEKSSFRVFSAQARSYYSPLIARMSERPSIDTLNDDALLDGKPSFKGLMCDAGYRFVRINSNGDVVRCGPVEMFGNLLNRTFERRRGPKPCNTGYCYYFCMKYSQSDTDVSRASDGPGVNADETQAGWHGRLFDLLRGTTYHRSR